jgi:hypothetical protein
MSRSSVLVLRFADERPTPGARIQTPSVRDLFRPGGRARALRAARVPWREGPVEPDQLHPWAQETLVVPGVVLAAYATNKPNHNAAEAGSAVVGRLGRVWPRGELTLGLRRSRHRRPLFGRNLPIRVEKLLLWRSMLTSTARPRRGAGPWRDGEGLELTSRVKPLSDRFCPKTSTGRRSQRSRRRPDWLSLSESRHCPVRI